MCTGAGHAFGRDACERCICLPVERWSAYRTELALTHCEATGVIRCVYTLYQVHACNDQLASALQESRMRRGLPGDDEWSRAERAAGQPAPVGLGGEAEEAWKPHAVAIANERLRLQVSAVFILLFSVPSLSSEYSSLCRMGPLGHQR